MRVYSVYRAAPSVLYTGLNKSENVSSGFFIDFYTQFLYFSFNDLNVASLCSSWRHKDNERYFCYIYLN